jgi:hypothetical protein
MVFDPDAARMYPCNEVMGSSVVGEWFSSGFEAVLPGDHWQVVASDEGHVENWADPRAAAWSARAASRCADSWEDLDRVLYVATSSKAMTADAWTAALRRVIENLRGQHIHLKHVELATALRPPGDRRCRGNPESLVPPEVDEAIARIVAAYPRLVAAAPKLYAPTCKVFRDGGPHLTEKGKAVAARLYAEAYEKEPR